MLLRIKIYLIFSILQLMKNKEDMDMEVSYYNFSKKRYPHTIMLCIEEVDEKYDNYKQRVHREKLLFKKWTSRNGL